jgi:hypothetical protein
MGLSALQEVFRGIQILIISQINAKHRLDHGLHPADLGSHLAVVAGRAVFVVDCFQGFTFLLVFVDQIACQIDDH